LVRRCDAIVVGAGPAGLAAAATLKQRGFDIVQYEKATEVGAVWRRHYDRLHLHTDRSRSGLPGLPMPKAYGRYPSRAQVVAYLESYAKAFGLTPLLGVEVRTLSRAGSLWRAEAGEVSAEAPVAVVATGIADFPHRPNWPANAAVGKTLVSSSMIDRVVTDLGRKLSEVPVGFKWFAPGLFDGSICFGGEESAGASFLRRDGSVWTTDKDGPIMDLLAAEITARTDKDPGEHYRELTAKFGAPCYTRIDAPATPEQKAVLKKLSPEMVTATTLAGESITAKLTKAPGNNAPIGGLKVVAASGWFAARPSGTENIYKIYAESFRDDKHLQAIVAEAQEIVGRALV